MDGWDEVTELLQDRINGNRRELEERIRELQIRIADDSNYMVGLEKRIEVLEGLRTEDMRNSVGNFWHSSNELQELEKRIAALESKL